MKLRVLTGSDVRKALPMREAVDAMREAFVALHKGEVMLPARTHLHPVGQDTMSLTMPAALMEPRRMGAKLLTLNNENPTRGLPVIHGLVVMFDPRNGAPTGLLEGTVLTAIRTGAVCGLATDLLARPDVTAAAILGAGVQAPGQLQALCAVRDIKRATIWSRSFERAQRLARRLSDTPGLPDEITAVSTVEEAVQSVDVITTATPSSVPLITADHVRPGIHINAVGAYTPQMTEIAPDVIGKSNVVVDQLEAAMVESGELIEAVKRGVVTTEDFSELGAIAAGAAPPRRSNEDITLFKSVGLAVQDLSAGGWALERAFELGIGTDLEL